MEFFTSEGCCWWKDHFSRNPPKTIVTSCSCEHMLLTYSLRTLVCKWSGFSIWCLFWLWILLMMLMYYGAMLFDIYVLTDAIDEFTWVCRAHARLWMSMTSMDLLGLRIQSGSGLCFVWVFHFTHMCQMIDLISLCIWISDSVFSMDAGWWCLLIWLT